MSDLEALAARVEAESVERLSELRDEIVELMPPIDAAPCHWLNRDSCYSYCWPCARKARWNELPSVGPVPEEVDWWKRDPIEELIQDGIDGGWSGSESDHCEACELCGCTLEYSLTDYGRGEEITNFLTYPTADNTIDGEVTYALDRIFVDLSWDGADAQQVADATTIAEQTLAALRSRISNPKGDGDA